MYMLAIALIAAAGGCYCAAALVRWRILGRQDDASGQGYLWPLWIGLALHSAALAIGLIEGTHTDFTYGVLGLWAAVASLFFLGRFLAVPSKWLLVLPIGGMALLVATSAVARQAGVGPAQGTAGGGWITAVHVLFMSTHMAAALVAGAAGGLYLLADRQLKSAKPSAFRLPNLPLLERLSERGLVVAAALLIGGLATGGAAMQASARGVSLMTPVVLLSMVTMAVLTIALAMRVANRLSRRGVATTAICCLALTAVTMVSQLLGAHD